MTTLSAQLVISLIDQFTGPAGKIKGAASSLQRLEQTGARLQQSGRSMMATYTAPIAAGLTLLTEKAAEFEKKMLQVSFANLEGGARNQAEWNEQISHSLDLTSKIRDNINAVSKDIGVSPTFLAGSAALYAKAGINDPALQQAYLRTTGIAHMADPEADSAEVARTLNSMRTLLNFPQEANAHIKALNREFDQLVLASKHSKYSFSEYQHAFQTVLPLATAMGVSTKDLEADLGAMSQGGITADKAGTAWRSIMIRAMNPTAGGMQALTDAGIDRNKYFDMTGADTRKAANLIDAEFAGKLGSQKGAKRQLIDILQKAKTEGFSEDSLAAVERFVARKTGMNTPEGLAKVAETVLNAVGAATKVKDWAGYEAALAEAIAKDPSLAQKVVEPRQASNLQALLKMHEEREKLAKLLEKPDGISEAILQIRNMSLPGQLETLSAAWERFSISIGRSGAIGVVARMLVNVADALDRIGPDKVQLLTTALIGLAAVGPGLYLVGSAMRLMALAGRGVGAATAVLGLTRGAKAVAAAEVAAPLMNMATNAKRVTAGVEAAASARMIAGMGTAKHLASSSRMIAGMSEAGGLAAMVPPGIGARIMSIVGPLGQLASFAGRLTLIGAAIGAIVFAVQNAEGIGQMLMGIGDGFMKSLGPETKKMLDDISNAFTSFGSSLGISADKWKSWGETVGGALGSTIEQVAKLFNGLKALFDWASGTSLSKMLFGDDRSKLNDAKAWTDDLKRQYGGGTDKTVPPGLTSGPTVKAAGNAVATGHEQLDASAAHAGDAGADLSQVQNGAQQAVNAVNSAMSQVRQIVASVDLTAEGARIAHTIAAGIRSGAADIAAAVHEAVGAAAHNAVRNSLSDAGLR